MVRDGDAPEWNPEMFAHAVARKGLKPVAKKALLSLRIDSDVIEWFKSQVVAAGGGKAATHRV